jgi:formate dehydrogenase (coenzyme F420) beta subunit
MTSLDRLRTQMQHVAAGLLHSGHVDRILGYRKAGFPLRTRPVCISKPSGAAVLVWSSFCSVNLAVYLPQLIPAGVESGPGLPNMVGLFAKPCDARCALVLTRLGRVDRDRLFLIVIRCPGMIDWRKVEEALGGAEVLGAGEDAAGNLRAVVGDGSEVKLPRWALADETCLACRDRSPGNANLVIDLNDHDLDVRGDGVLPAATPRRSRLALHRGGLARCLLCRACERACPFASSTETEETRPCGQDAILAYHRAREARVAAACGSCGVCARVCPAGVDPRPSPGGA